MRTDLKLIGTILWYQYSSTYYNNNKRNVQIIGKMNSFTWFPRSIWCNPELKYAFVILNSDISNQDRIIKLWNHASFRVLVDGGANNWFDLSQDRKHDIINPIPNLVTGDFDSIHSKVKKYYETKVVSCRVVCTPNQDFTDFTKALQEMAKFFPNSDEIDAVYVFTEYGGRLDQVFGLFETLFHAKNIQNLPQVFLISSNSTDWLLQPGTHTIDLQCNEAMILDSSNDVSLKDRHCGLIPLGEPCTNIRTSGLKWNLCNSQTLRFGTLVSTSNGFSSNVVTIENTTPLVWTMEN